jgi:hypothetical protein
MNMQKTVVLLVILVGILAHGQSVYATKSGQLSFAASQPTFEPIAAQHTAVSALLKTETGELAILALVRGFRFKLALMEEHFNENYIESHRYPKTHFTGTLVNVDWETLDQGPQTVTITGKLQLHGITKPLSTNATLAHQDNGLLLTAAFSVQTSDYKIAIPKLVRKQIAEEVQIEVKLPLQIR